jgi:hypothetical protein
MILNDSSSFEEYDNLEMRSIFNCQNFINQKTMGFMGIILLNPTINYSHKSNGIQEKKSFKSHHFTTINMQNKGNMGFMGIILLNPTINYSHKSNGIYENYSVKSQLSILLLVKIPILKNSSILFLEQRGN